MRSWQLALDLGTLATAPPIPWDGFPVEDQDAAVAALARLIAQVAVREEEARSHGPAAEAPVG